MPETILPMIPDVPTDLTARQRPFLASLKEIIEVREQRRGDPLDAFVSIRDLRELIHGDETIISYLTAYHDHNASHISAGTFGSWYSSTPGDYIFPEKLGIGVSPLYKLHVAESFDLATLPLGDNSNAHINTTISGVAVGNPLPTGVYGLSTTTTLTGDYDSGIFWSCGLYNNMYFSGSGFDNGALSGIRNDMTINGSSKTGELVMLENYFWHAGSGEVADVIGCVMQIGVSGGGSIPEAWLFYGSYSLLSGTITDRWGIYLINEEKNYLSGTLQCGNITIGEGAAGVDYTLTFDGETSDGVITWMEDEDAFTLASGLGLDAGAVLNWGTTLGASGFGIRDNSGWVQVKHSDYEDTWEDIERTHETDKSIVIREDFTSASPPYATGWITGGVGAGSGYSAYAEAANSNHLGANSLRTGTTATGYTLMSLAPGWSFAYGGNLKMEWIVSLEALSDGTEGFKVLVGLGNDILGGEHTNGILFTYTDTESSGHWECVTKEGGSETSTDSGLAAAGNTWTRLTAVMSADAQTVKFYIDGTLVATHDTNIPDSETCWPISKIIKSVGITSRNLRHDSFYLRKRVAR